MENETKILKISDNLGKFISNSKLLILDKYCITTLYPLAEYLLQLPGLKNSREYVST